LCSSRVDRADADLALKTVVKNFSENKGFCSLPAAHGKKATTSFWQVADPGG
jgi:hypothetical protein